MSCALETKEPCASSSQRDWPVVTQACCGPQLHPYPCGPFGQLSVLSPDLPMHKQSFLIQAVWSKLIKPRSGNPAVIRG